MDEQQETVRRFHREIIRVTGWTPSKLAGIAGMAHTTLTRFLNNEEVKHTSTMRTIEKVRNAVVTAKLLSEDQIDQLWLMARRAPPPRDNPRRRSS